MSSGDVDSATAEGERVRYSDDNVQSLLSRLPKGLAAKVVRWGMNSLLSQKRYIDVDKMSREELCQHGLECWSEDAMKFSYIRGGLELDEFELLLDLRYGLV